MRSKPTPVQMAWAAGLFEGEGCIVPRGKTAVEVILGMVDEDVVRRFAEIAGAGDIRTEPRADGHQTLYRWALSESGAIRDILTMFRPYMGARRGAKTDEMLERLTHNHGPNGAKTHCKRGHEFTPENTKRDRNGGRVCIACRRQKQRESSARARAAQRNTN